MSAGQSEQMNVIFLGDPNVGKSSLIKRLLGEEFVQAYEQTRGFHVFEHIILADTKLLNLKIFDIPASLVRSFFNFYAAEAACVVFDVTSRDSFNNLPFYIDKIKAVHPQFNDRIVLIANKVDEQEVVADEEIEAFAAANEMVWIKTSAASESPLANLDHCLRTILTQKQNVETLEPVLEELMQKLESYKESYVKKPEVQNICNFLKNCILRKSQGENVQTFIEDVLEDKDFQKDLNALWWTYRSVFNSLVNLVITVFLALSIVGFPIAYCTGLLDRNKKESGHSCMFFKFGEYQAVKAQANQVFAEVDVTCRL